MKTEPVRTVDIPMSLRETIAGRISDYTIGLAKTVGPDHSNFTLAGSGTLVAIEGHHAILTAVHVADEILKHEHFGLVLSGNPKGKLHRVAVFSQIVNKVTINRPKGLGVSEPPDIALLILPQGQVGAITARKSFYNLSTHRDALLFDPPAPHMGLWAFCGFADEWTADQTPRAGFERIVSFNGRIMWGMATPLETKSDFDAWEFPIERGKDYDGPVSFEGYSGGGLWQNLFRKKSDGELELTHNYLSGVAFHQSGFRNDVNSIRFNGRRCIYESIYDAFTNKLAS